MIIPKNFLAPPASWGPRMLETRTKPAHPCRNSLLCVPRGISHFRWYPRSSTFRSVDEPEVCTRGEGVSVRVCVRRRSTVVLSFVWFFVSSHSLVDGKPAHAQVFVSVGMYGVNVPAAVSRNSTLLYSTPWHRALEQSKIPSARTHRVPEIQRLPVRAPARANKPRTWRIYIV